MRRGEKVRRPCVECSAFLLCPIVPLIYIPTTPARLPLRWFNIASVTSRRTPRRCGLSRGSGAGHATTCRKHRMGRQALTWLSVSRERYSPRCYASWVETRASRKNFKKSKRYQPSLAEGVGFEPTIRFQVCTLFQWLVDERANVISPNASISRPKARQISDA